MSELKIDEQNIGQICKDALLLARDIVEDTQTLENKDIDVFRRYMAMVRLGSVFQGAKNALHMGRHLFCMGFDIQHEYFQTKEAKENGWDKVRIEDNPFFVNDEGDREDGIKVEFKELPDDLKEVIINAIRSKFGATKPEQTH